MDTFGFFWGWWCLVPLLFIALAAAGCFLMARRHGGACMGAGTCCGTGAPRDAKEARP